MISATRIAVRLGLCEFLSRLHPPTHSLWPFFPQQTRDHSGNFLSHAHRSSCTKSRADSRHDVRAATDPIDCLRNEGDNPLGCACKSKPAGGVQASPSSRRQSSEFVAARKSWRESNRQ